MHEYRLGGHDSRIELAEYSEELIITAEKRQAPK